MNAIARRTFADLGDYVRTTFKTPGSDFLASVVVFLVALPLCMGIAIASGVPVSAGIITGIVGGIVVGSLAGAPLQVSGPAAGLTVIVADMVQRHGFEMLGIAVLVGGAIQLTAGLFKLGQWFRAVSPAVVQGMLAGIGILIFCSQFHVMVDDAPKHGGIENLITIPQAVMKGLPLPEPTSLEERQARSTLLQEFGALHETQVQIREGVEEEVDGPTGRVGNLGGLLQRQRQIVDRLAVHLAPAAIDPAGAGPDAVKFDDRPKYRMALEDAHRVNAEALAALEAADRGDPDVAELLTSQIAADQTISLTLGSLKDHAWAAKIGLLALVILIAWQTLTPKRVRLLPGALIAVLAAAGLAATFALPVLYVEVPNDLWSEIHFPTWTTATSAPWWEVLQLGAVLAIVASAETLLCATAVDRLQSEAKTDYDRELAAQGVGNMICGCLGALPMTGVIVRSAANVQAGGKSRLSAILHGVWILVFVSFLAFLLRMIPVAALAAILVYTGYKLVNLKAVKELYKHGWGEVFIYAVTVIVIVVEDLLSGVIVGIVLSAAKLLFTFSRLKTHLEVRESGKEAVLHLDGAATFVRLPYLAKALEEVPDGVTLHVDLTRLQHIDHACLDLLRNWGDRHENSGGRLLVDWESLHPATKKGDGDPDAEGGGKTPVPEYEEVASS